MFMRASQPTDSALPLRGYFLSVGGALLCLLLLASWVLPAQLPAHPAEPDPPRPPIRIHSDVKLPERIVIEVSPASPARVEQQISIAAIARSTRQ
ncbi:hypothetical protein [Bradyrhizobium yuanmingense]|uniref:hypothetical protein n=1 Tax=Bradyrhizobium yuanmingense TaxID=108015 RepID=UPI0023B8BBF1|nr:hypothetical protein [Bradyrhizobium yuanmingense]MDF0493699.1 hypothetical protein [Bradyrhizobium yuanmingense]